MTKIIHTPFFMDQPVAGYATQPDWYINQPSDLSGDTPQQRFVPLYQPIAEFVAKHAKAGEPVVSFAGDCCASLGVWAGLQNAGISPTLLWFDAHGDFNTWDTTPSKFLGGMPLAWLTGRGEQTVMDGLGVPTLLDEQVILTDARDLDEGEAKLVADSGLTHLPQVGDLLTRDLPSGDLWVHFDADVLDGGEMPASPYSTPHGSATPIIRQVFQKLAQTKRIAAISLSAWHPNLDPDGHAEKLCWGLVQTLLGNDD